MPKDNWAKAKRGDIARKATAKAGFEHRERHRTKAKQSREAHSKAKPALTKNVHPKQQQIDAAEHRVAEHGMFFDFDILLRLEQAALGSGDAFYEALVMMRLRIESAND